MREHRHKRRLKPPGNWVCKPSLETHPAGNTDLVTTSRTVQGFSPRGSQSLAGMQRAQVDVLRHSSYPHGDQTTREPNVPPVVSCLLAVSSVRGHCFV